jgi:serine/threonine protein kinase
MADPHTLISHAGPAGGFPRVDFTLPTTVANTLAAEPGSHYGRYRIETCLGAGGMGAVYRASDPVLGRSVALKTAVQSDEQQDVSSGIRFLREAEVLAKLRHPHIVGVHDLGMHGDTPFIVLEYLDGTHLRALLDARKRLELELALRVLLPVFAGVSHAHSREVLHLDLKPSNIFLCPEPHNRWTPKVLDFGVCQLSGIESELDPTRSDFAGTPAYCSPEALSGEILSAASDQFSLGVIVYEAIAGINPFAEARSLPQIRTTILERKYHGLSTLVPHLPESVSAAVHRSLSGVPSERFPSVRAFGAELLRSATLETRARWMGEFSDG